MGRIKKTRYVKSLSVPNDINFFFKWIQEEGIERSGLITQSIRKMPLYKTFLKATGYERSLIETL